jgi:Mn2+/Fe2+ NRAMP family transporter
MATSAIGPGFLTQTAVFTQQLGASFGFAILASIVLDLGAQLTTWRVIAAAGQPAGAVADAVRPGLGRLLVAMVALGGLAFNIGNVAGAGLGLNVLTGLDVRVGAALSAVGGIGLFLSREAGRAMDRFAQYLGILMVALTAWVAWSSSPPLAEAAWRAVAPERLDLLSITTLVGGTVGGYITFAGAHRLLDAGIFGVARIPQVTVAAARAIGIASFMRVVLFLAALGVVSSGAVLDPSNPPASVFRIATGELGYRVFGLVMWAAAITSVVGAAYTSISFLRTLHPAIERSPRHWIIGFIAASTLVFLVIGRPVRTLVLVGALNALVLPIGLSVMLLAARRRDIVGDYHHPVPLVVLGWGVAVAMAGMGLTTLIRDVPRLWTGG